MNTGPSDSSSSSTTPTGTNSSTHSSNTNKNSELTQIVVAQLTVLSTTIRDENWDSTVNHIHQVCIFDFRHRGDFKFGGEFFIC